MHIDTDKWGSFPIKKLFDIHPTKAYKNTNATLMESDGINPVIVNSSYNNGIGGYTNLPTTEDGGMITFSDTTSCDAIFYQDKPFVGYAHVQGLYPIGKYKDMWTEKRLLFFLCIFKKRAADLNYDYVNKFTRDSAKLIELKLPIDSNGDPDWAYMDNYISSIQIRVKGNLAKLLLVANK